MTTIRLRRERVRLLADRTDIRADECTVGPDAPIGALFATTAVATITITYTDGDTTTYTRLPERNA